MVQPAWREERGHHLFRTQFAMVSPRSVSNPEESSRYRQPAWRSGVGTTTVARWAAGWSETTYPSGKSEWRFIPRELANGRLSFIHIFEKKDARQTRGANLFMTTLERMKMLDSLQHTWLQNAVVGAMYAATIESELGTDKAMEFIAGAGEGAAEQKVMKQWIGEYLDYYTGSQVKMNRVKIPHLFPRRQAEPAASRQCRQRHEPTGRVNPALCRRGHQYRVFGPQPGL